MSKLPEELRQFVPRAFAVREGENGQGDLLMTTEDDKTHPVLVGIDMGKAGLHAGACMAAIERHAQNHSVIVFPEPEKITMKELDALMMDGIEPINLFRLEEDIKAKERQAIENRAREIRDRDTAHRRRSTGFMGGGITGASLLFGAAMAMAQSYDSDYLPAPKRYDEKDNETLEALKKKERVEEERRARESERQRKRAEKKAENIRRTEEGKIRAREKAQQRYQEFHAQRPGSSSNSGTPI